MADAMQELNENVEGNYVEDDPAELLAAQPAFFRAFTLIMATQARQSAMPTRQLGVQHHATVWLQYVHASPGRASLM